DCNNALVYNCTVIDAGDNPITLDTSTSNSIVKDCTVVGGQDVGINDWGGTNCIIEDNNVANVTQYSGASHWGIADEYGVNIDIIDNTISGCSYDLVDAGNNTLVEGNTINGLGISGGGIQVQN